MPLTKLDSIAALLVIDLQKGIASIPTVHPISEIIGRSAQLARAFRDRLFYRQMAFQRARIRCLRTQRATTASGE